MKSGEYPISLVVCDLAGTTVDYGSRAPLAAFVEVFARHGVTASEAEAREPMGMHKRDHIERMLSMPGIAAQWERAHGRKWTIADLDMLFREFLPLQTAILDAYSEIIPGAVEAVALWKSLGIKVAATTGYNREMTDMVLAAAARQGLTFDYSCCAAEVPAGRPAPWMIFRCMEATGIYPPSAVLKIGDTIADIEDGLNAGAWTVGVTMTGNMLGLSRQAAEEMGKTELAVALASAHDKMAEAGAHMTVKSVADASSIMAALDQAVAKGRHPGKRGLLPKYRIAGAGERRGLRKEEASASPLALTPAS